MDVDKNSCVVIQEEKKNGKLVSVTIHETENANLNTYKLNLIDGNFKSLTVTHDNQRVASFEKKEGGAVLVNRSSEAKEHEVFAEYPVKVGESVMLPGREIFWVHIRNNEELSKFFFNSKIRVFQFETGKGKRARFEYNESQVKRVQAERAEDSLSAEILSREIKMSDSAVGKTDTKRSRGMTRRVCIGDDIIDVVGGVCISLFCVSLVAGTYKTLQKFWNPRIDKKVVANSQLMVDGR